MTTRNFTITACAASLTGLLAFTPAQAADLGGDCCADLEERVAELEATSVRKGNRKVSLKLSGHVNKAVLYWDDGVNDDVYVVDNSESESRFRLTGTAPLAPGWSTGFKIEMELFGARGNNVDARFDGAPTENNDHRVVNRVGSFFIKNDQLGKLTVGRDSPVTDNLILLNIAKNPIADADMDNSRDFHLVRPQGSLGCTGASCRSNINRDLIMGNQDTRRADIIRYDSPSLFGLVISAAWGEDDLADVAIRYKKEWNSIRLIAGVGYLWDTDETEGGATTVIACPGPGLGAATCVDERVDFERLVGSASAMHVPSGVYLYGAAGHETFGVSNAQSHLSSSTFTAPVTGQQPEDATMWYVQAGIKRRLLLPNAGATTLYAEYQQWNDWGVRRDAGSLMGVGAGVSEITDTSADMWGFGVVQDIDPAATKVYLGLRWYDHTVRVATGGPAPLPNNAPAGADVSLEELFTATMGAKISF